MTREERFRKGLSIINVKGWIEIRHRSGKLLNLHREPKMERLLDFFEVLHRKHPVVRCFLSSTLYPHPPFLGGTPADFINPYGTLKLYCDTSLDVDQIRIGEKVYTIHLIEELK